MATECEREKKCEDHKKVFLGVCGFYCVALLTMISYMVINNNRAIGAEQEITKELNDAKLIAAHEHQQMMDKFSSHMDELKTEVLQRLSKLESKIEAKM